MAPIMIPQSLTLGTGLMNPSVFIDDDGDILVNLRHVNYVLYHAEGRQRFPSLWGPLAYLHPENDMALRTINYLCRLDENLSLTDWTQVEMLELHTPIWEFTGLEDARLVKWDGDYYLIGVRRDTTPNGQGRMEYSRIEIDKKAWTATETNRVRIPDPKDENAYCNKNWVPILDLPYHMVKWTNPTEIVWADPNEPVCNTVSITDTYFPMSDQRGSSHVLHWKNYYISITHEVNLYKNYLNQKDAVYRHRLFVWDENFTMLGASEPFSFLDAQIEFCAGAAIYKGDLLISFGFVDNSAYILKMTEDLVDEMISEAVNAS